MIMFYRRHNLEKNYTNYINTNLVMCAGRSGFTNNSIDACGGDSGGPLILKLGER